MDLIIDRSKWLRGEGSQRSKLLREEDGKMCCLGFYALACGLTPEQIKGVSSPDQPEIKEAFADKASFLFLYNSGAPLERSNTCAILMGDNDAYVSDMAMESEEERERLITLNFANNGVTVKFIDGI